MKAAVIAFSLGALFNLALMWGGLAGLKALRITIAAILAYFVLRFIENIRE